jgi:hypothetical protein
MGWHGHNYHQVKGRPDELHTTHHMQQMMWGKQTSEPVAPQVTALALINSTNAVSDGCD